MNRPVCLRRVLAPLLALALVCTLTLPASAFFWSKKDGNPFVSDFSKNGMIGSIIAFDREDFVVQTKNKAVLNSILIETLPDPLVGILVIGGQPVEVGSVVDSTALSGLRFQSSAVPSVTTTTFTFTPSFSSGQDCDPTTVTIHLLSEANEAPIARNIELSTYRNVAITGYFDALDSEGDLLSFQLTSNPARGAVTMESEASSEFVYTPYENKSGNDSFTYVAVDTAGNISTEAKVTIRIDKADTNVTYADLSGHSAHKSAIRLAEEGVYVGQYVDGRYFFEPNQPVSRAQFLTMAMAVSDMPAFEDVTLTGFYDDEAIPTWAKGSISAALKAGAVLGSRDENGAPVFGPDITITRAEATVMLNKLLGVTDVPAEVFSAGLETHWAAQAVANLSATGIMRTENMGVVALGDEMTRGEVAQMLDGALDVLAARAGGGWLPWR